MPLNFFQFPRAPTSRIVGEFLPSATDPGATFTAITQIGTEMAVLVYFRRDIARIVGQWARALVGRAPGNDPDARMGWQIIIGTIPIGLAGYLAQSYIRSAFRSLPLTAVVLIVFGVALGLADRLGKHARELSDLSIGHGILCGFAQALALIPGVSRSGATTTMGLGLGYTRPAAAEYAFLLAVPAVFASGLYELLTSFRGSKFLRSEGNGPCDRRLLWRWARYDLLSYEIHFEAQFSAIRNLSSPSRWQAARSAVQGYPAPQLSRTRANWRIEFEMIIWRLRRLLVPQKGQSPLTPPKKYKQPLLPPESRTARHKLATYVARADDCNTLLGASNEICSPRTGRCRTGMQVLRSLLSKGSGGLVLLPHPDE